MNCSTVRDKIKEEIAFFLELSYIKNNNSNMIYFAG